MEYGDRAEEGNKSGNVSSLRQRSKRDGREKRETRLTAGAQISRDLTKVQWGTAVRDSDVANVPLVD